MKCPSHSCNETYIGETAKRLASKIKEHGGKCEQSNVTRHSVDSGHNLVQPSNFQMVTQNQLRDINIRKQAEALLIQQYKPEGAIVQLKLF